MPELDDLPEETVQIICTCLLREAIRVDEDRFAIQRRDRHLARVALARLCLTSRRYRRIAQAILWKVHGAGLDPEHELLLFATLLRYPHLAGHVESVDFQGWLLGWLEFSPKDLIYGTFADDIIRGFNVDFGDEWIDRLRHKEVGCQIDAFLSLFLAMFSRLKVLRLRWPSEVSSDYNILGQVATAHKLFRGCERLEKLIVYQEISLSCHFDNAISLLTLPALKKVRIGGISESAIYKLQPSNLNITDIILERAYVRSGPLRILMQAFKRIAHAEFLGFGCATNFTEVIPPNEVVECLRIHSSTLKSLTLVYILEEAYGFFAPTHPWRDSAVMESLQHLDALEDLHVDSMCFLYALQDSSAFGIVPRLSQILINQLPRSLRNLTICRVVAEMIAAVERIATCDAGLFPHLRSVTIYVEQDHLQDLYESLHDSFREAKIEYRVGHLHTCG